MQNNSLPFNKYAYLTTHNSYAIEGEPSHTGVPRVTFDNQEDSVTQQLNVELILKSVSKSLSFSFILISSLCFLNLLKFNLFNLQNGVRALMLDTYDFDDDVWLCHSNGGK